MYSTSTVNKVAFIPDTNFQHPKQYYLYFSWATVREGK